MEIKSAIYRSKRICLCILVMAFSCLKLSAQTELTSCTIRNGNMSITLSKNISGPALDSFVAKFDLFDLDLRTLVRTGIMDSLRKLGWMVSQTRELYIITKPFQSFGEINNPANKILFAEKNQHIEELFPPVSSQVKFGYNRFRNKYPFAVNDSSVTFYLRGNTNAQQVILSGSFIRWSPDALRMIKTDSGWILKVKLGPGKYWYKFIIDGGWTTDRDNALTENDGMGNNNSVYYKTNMVFRLNGYKNARRVFLAGSFNGWNEKELQMTETGTGWELPLYLANGTHTYRFIANGRWMEDPGNPSKLPNEFGEYNSMVQLGKAYLFHLPGYTDAKKVALSGSFNGWRRDELFMNKKENGWELLYTLGPGNYEYTFVVDGKAAKASSGSGNLHFIIEPNYTFRLRGFENAKAIYLAGDFNNWSPNTFAMKRENGAWAFTVHLSPGKHLYKFVVDGKWIIDPDNKLWEQNEHDTGNSIVWIENKSFTPPDRQ